MAIRRLIANIKCCPECLISSMVVDSRNENGEIVRIRQCPLCRKRWVTREILDTRSGFYTKLDHYFKEEDFLLKGENYADRTDSNREK